MTNSWQKFLCSYHFCHYVFQWFFRLPRFWTTELKVTAWQHSWLVGRHSEIAEPTSQASFLVVINSFSLSEPFFFCWTPAEISGCARCFPSPKQLDGAGHGWAGTSRDGDSESKRWTQVSSVQLTGFWSVLGWFLMGVLMFFIGHSFFFCLTWGFVKNQREPKILQKHVSTGWILHDESFSKPVLTIPMWRVYFSGKNHQMTEPVNACCWRFEAWSDFTWLRTLGCCTQNKWVGCFFFFFFPQNVDGLPSIIIDCTCSYFVGPWVHFFFRSPF